MIIFFVFFSDKGHSTRRPRNLRAPGLIVHMVLELPTHLFSHLAHILLAVTFTFASLSENRCRSTEEWVGNLRRLTSVWVMWRNVSSSQNIGILNKSFSLTGLIARAKVRFKGQDMWEEKIHIRMTTQWVIIHSFTCKVYETQMSQAKVSITSVI